MNPDYAMLPPAALAAAVADLWRLKPPGPANLYSAPAFVQLQETCLALYGVTRSKHALGFALHKAVRTLGLPCALTPSEAHLALSSEVAAARLNAAFRAPRCKLVHLCPLNLAGELPVLQFGPNRIGTFSAAELDEIMDSTRLKRTNSNWNFDSRRFSEFRWLVVREEVALDCEAGARLGSEFVINLSADLGCIYPHPERFPNAVEGALLAVLLAPWEDWAEMPEVDWRPFRIPWVYTIDDNIFVGPSPPPSPDTLSWEPHFYTDHDGEVFEEDRPTQLPLTDAAASACLWLNDAMWGNLCLVRKSPLFETPITHFLLRAYLTEDIDEFLAHITVVEAALGLKIDHERRMRTRFPGGKNPGATYRVKTRLSALLGGKADGDKFGQLFDLRSEYLHGRQMSPISTDERVLARRLARRTVEALCKAALAKPTLSSRDAYLEELLNVGLVLI